MTSFTEAEPLPIRRLSVSSYTEPETPVFNQPTVEHGTSNLATSFKGNNNLAASWNRYSDAATGFNGNSNPTTGFSGNSNPATSFNSNSNLGTSLNGNGNPTTSFNGNINSTIGFNGYNNPSTSFNGNNNPATNLNGNRNPATSLNYNSSLGTSVNGYGVEPRVQGNANWRDVNATSNSTGNNYDTIHAHNTVVLHEEKKEEDAVVAPNPFKDAALRKKVRAPNKLSPAAEKLQQEMMEVEQRELEFRRRSNQY